MASVVHQIQVERETFRSNAAAIDCAFLHHVLIDGKKTEVEFRVTSAGDLARHGAASLLLKDRYSWRGYGAEHEIPSSAYHTTFTTEIGGVVVGTLTLAIDSREGLAIDKSFPEYTSSARQLPGSRICELTRFAFDSSVKSKQVLAGLFHMVFIYGTTVSDCSDLFIEVHPRHANFYDGMLGFKAVGRAGVNASVRAPSQLMKLKVDDIRCAIVDSTSEAGRKTSRSLYGHFFSQVHELQIRALFSLQGIQSVSDRLDPGLIAERHTVEPLKGADRRPPNGSMLKRLAPEPQTRSSISQAA